MQASLLEAPRNMRNSLCGECLCVQPKQPMDECLFGVCCVCVLVCVWVCETHEAGWVHSVTDFFCKGVFR